MKKALSLLMAFLMLFLSLCVGANAVGAEQSANEIQTQADRIVLTDDELKEKFGIEQILLPEGFEPVAYVYYDQISGKYPEYITFVFTDGTTLDVTGNSVTENNIKIEVYYYYYNYFSNDKLIVTVYVADSENNGVAANFVIDCKIEEQPFSENLKIYSQKTLMCFLGLAAGQNPGYSEHIYFDGNFINDIINGFYRGREELFNRDYFLDEFLFDVCCITLEFIVYCFPILAPRNVD